MRVAILDDIHHAYDGTAGVRRLRERAEVRIFTAPFENPAALRGFDALVANRERTRFTRERRPRANAALSWRARIVKLRGVRSAPGWP